MRIIYAGRSYDIIQSEVIIIILVVGGAFQGKTEFVKNKWKIDESEIYNSNIIDESIKNYRVINNFNEIIKNYINNSEYAMNLIMQSSIEIIIADEIGCGVVPVDKNKRILREQISRSICEAAKCCSEVYRVYCSIGQRIK